MNKRITSLLLCFVMVFAMLATAVPAFAWSTETAEVELSVVPDKTQAKPGDTITYTVNIGPVKRLQSVNFTLIIPDTLEYGVGKEVDGLKDLLGADKAEYTDSTKTMVIGGGGSYTSESVTPLMKFTCTVKNTTAAGSTVEVEIMDDWEIADNEWETYPNIKINSSASKVTITAAPKPATGISLDKNALSLVEGNYETLTATVSPTDTTDTVTWSSDKTSVATVDSTGKVTAVAAGTAKITATAGTKTATCTVTVTCKHNFSTVVPEKASDCTNKGWDAYMVCSKCNEVQRPTGEILSGIPYRSLDANAHDFDATAWGYKGADGHAHVCKLNAAHHDTVVAHNPDRAAPTENEAVKCLDCGYVIAEATGHVHKNHLTHKEYKAATCTEAGNKEYYVCDCGKYFEDATASVEITDTSSVILNAIGHSYTVKNSDDAHKRSTASDCRAYDTYWYTCANDASHSAKDDAAATDKYYNGAKGAHAYSTAWTAYGESGHAHKCLYDDSTTGMTAHNPDSTEPTETEAVKCLDCGYVITEATGHVHKNHLTHKEYKAATCTEAGNKEYYVCDCGKYFEDATASVEITDTSSVILNAIGHSYTVKNSDDAHKRSTASDCREYDTYWYTCANDASHSAKDDPNATDKYYNGNQGAHAYGTDWVDCGESGHAHKCLYDDSTTDLTAHSPDRTEPTETEAVKCLDCGYVITPELGHTHSLVKVEGKDADCDDNGMKEHYKCEGCNKLFEDATGSAEITDESILVIPATGHSFVWVTDKEATEAETGLKHEECTVCHEKRNENTVIEKLAKADKADNTSKDNAEKSPKTGEDSSIGEWVAILFVSGGVLLVTGFYCRKRRSRAE